MIICTSIAIARSRMKVLILVLFAISLQYNAAVSVENFGDVIENYEEYLKGIGETCIAVSKVSPELVQGLVYEGVFPENNELKEFVLCVGLGLGIIDENGNLDKDKTMSYIGTDDAKINEAVYEKCASVTADTAIDKIWGVGTCIYNTVKSLYKL
ncbi:hypothetical protein FQA39_LY08088 [Lamprigera yunnana]|nr:hypothetical protein FQA39_LY08088 [Lamprigera yunnana]